jgi:hypothetical protein
MKHADIAMYLAKAASSLVLIGASPAPLLEAAERMEPQHHRDARATVCVPLESL